jgi:hypothetical protein
MTAITFPRSATTGTEFVANNGVTYYWAGDRWAQSTHNRVKYVNEGGDAAHEYSNATDFTIDGGIGDNTIFATVISSELYGGQCYPYYGNITYNIIGTGAIYAGIIVQGLSVNYTQTIEVAHSQGEHTEYIPVLDSQLQDQTATVTLYVVDSREYGYYIPVSNEWVVAHTN